jgi:ATP-dependent protease La (LON) substrate-binding domain
MSEMPPLFPLGTVLYPGMVLPLHIFEDRYRRLVGDLPDEPVLLSFIVAAAMVIDLPERQGLLDQPDVLGRLGAERALLSREAVMLRAPTSRPAPDLRYTPCNPTEPEGGPGWIAADGG